MSSSAIVSSSNPSSSGDDNSNGKFSLYEFLTLCLIHILSSHYFHRFCTGQGHPAWRTLGSLWKISYSGQSRTSHFRYFEGDLKYPWEVWYYRSWLPGHRSAPLVQSQGELQRFYSQSNNFLSSKSFLPCLFCYWKLTTKVIYLRKSRNCWLNLYRLSLHFHPSTWRSRKISTTTSTSGTSKASSLAQEPSTIWKNLKRTLWYRSSTCSSPCSVLCNCPSVPSTTASAANWQWGREPEAPPLLRYASLPAFSTTSSL